MIDTLFSRLPAPKSEGGFTLIELLVSTSLALVLFTALFTVLDTSQRVQARDTEWALTMQEDRAGLAQMTHEIRQASTTPFEKAEANTLAFTATFGGKSWTIKYECGVTQTGTAYDECVRSATESGGQAKKTTVVRDLINGTKVFSYSSSSKPTESDVVTLKIELHAVGELKQIDNSGYSNKTVVLENAAFVRSRDLSG